MVFGTRQRVKRAKEAVIRVGSTPLQIVPSYKYLGFTLDSTLSFNHHVKTVAAMVSYKAYLLAKIRKFLTDAVALKIDKSMILPYFDYGDVIYNSASQEGLDKLQRLQNRCLKICKGFTKMPHLENRRVTHINRVSKPSLLDDSEIRTMAHDTQLFKLQVPKVEAYKRSLQFAGSLQWNNLPVETRNIRSIDLLKSKQRATMGN